MTKVYLAARYSRRVEMQTYKKHLDALGFHVTSRWINGGHEIDTDVPHSPATLSELRGQFALEDIEDLESADWVISFTEPNSSPRSAGGRHVEFGIALALKKRVLVISQKENVFHHLPTVEFFNTWAEFLDTLQP